MKFVDANIFLYASIKPKRVISDKIKHIKEKSVEIVKRISKGEKALTSVVHISEISNILEDRISNKFAQEILENIIFDENIEIAEVNKEIYATSLELAKIHDISINDCVAAIIMKLNNIKEIYSFDSDFDKIEGIKRVEK